MANSYGQGVTGKAVSERFLRMKKEEAWKLDINCDTVTTPKSGRKATPKSGKGSFSMDENVDDDEPFTPTMKTKGALNKVKGPGRVAKSTPKGKNAKVFVDLDEDLMKDEIQAKIEDPFGGAENDYGFGGMNSTKFEAVSGADEADEV